MKITLVAGLLFLLLTASAPAQEFLGRNTKSWAKDLDRTDETSRRSAAFALGKLGIKAAPALPALVKRLQEDASPKVREAAAFALGEVGRDSGPDVASLIPVLARALKDDNYLVRRSAAHALGNLGPDAVVAKDVLAACLKDVRPEVRQNVAWALGKIGVAGLPGICQALADSDNLVKRDAAGALLSFDAKDARPALDDLLPLCSENDSEVRRAALAVLINIVRPEDTSALPAIGLALKDPDAEVRANAALALSNIGGKDAVAAVPVLLEALRRGDLDLRRQAAAAIRNLGPEAKAAVPDLVKALRDPDEEIRANAALALGGIGSNAESAVPALVQLIVDSQEKSRTRIEAAVSLSRIGAGPLAVNAVPTLLKVLENTEQDGHVRERIVWSLRVHNISLRTMPGVFPAFAKVIGEPRHEANRLLRYDCAFMLGALQGTESPPEVMDVLLEYLKDETIQLFDNKKTTVGGTGQETNSGKANIKESGKGDGRVMAVQALTQIGLSRLKQRRDIIQQLQVLADGESTNAQLRADCKKLLKSVK